MYIPSDITQISDKDFEIGGWISPEGLFFQARYYEHNEVADQVVSGFLHVVDVNYSTCYLEDHGWIRLETDGTIYHNFSATEQQINVLYTLYVRAKPSWYKTELFDHISPAVLETCHSHPMPPVPGQGDQENYQMRTRKGAYA